MRTFLDISTKPLSNSKVLIGIQKLPVSVFIGQKASQNYNMNLIKVVLDTNNNRFCSLTI